jgi:hypothetical protein
VSTLLGVLAAAALFALMGFSATRQGSRLETGAHCSGDATAAGSCDLQEVCDGCGEDDKAAGWWPERK